MWLSVTINITTVTSGQSNLTIGRIAAGHGRFSSIEGTLVPPGEYDWTCVSFGPPKSTIQMANWLVQPFLHSSRQKVPILTMGSSFPQNCFFLGGSGPPSSRWFPGPTQVLNPNGIPISLAVFAGLTSVIDWETDRPTDYVTWSVTIDRICVRSMGDVA